MSSKSKNLYRLVDLHDENNTKAYIYAGLALLLVISLVLRKSLIHFQNADYTIFSSWYDFIKIHGIHSFKYGSSAGFSNYNPPYTYFLYLVSLLPVSKIVAIKSLLALFDLVLAFSVYCVVKIFKPQGYIPAIAAIVTLYLPTVLFTGVLWGQFDQLYIAFMLFSLYFALKNNSRWAWAMFGIAIAIKFQAIFILPVLIIMCFKRIQWYDIIWGVIAFLVLTLPPVLAGRSVGSLLKVYPSQTSLFHGQLTLNAPNMYQWFPNSAYPYLYHAGIGIGLGATLLILLAALIYKKFSKEELLIATTLLLYLVPFLLPEMHERYFFPANISSLVLAFVIPRTTWITVSMQAITLLSYMPFLFNTEPVSMSILAIFNLVIIYGLGYYYMTISREKLSLSEDK